MYDVSVFDGGVTGPGETDVSSGGKPVLTGRVLGGSTDVDPEPLDVGPPSIVSLGQLAVSRQVYSRQPAVTVPPTMAADRTAKYLGLTLDIGFMECRSTSSGGGLPRRQQSEH